MRPVWGWSMKLFRYGWLPHDIALLFLFQTRAAHSHAGWTWIWICFCSNMRPDCAPCIAGGSDSRRCNALLEIQHLHLHPLYLVWSLWVGHIFFIFLSIDYFACWLWNSKCFLTSSTSVGFEPTCWWQPLQYVYRFRTERLVTYQFRWYCLPVAPPGRQIPQMWSF